jgi:hypothetical protein
MFKLPTLSKLPTHRVFDYTPRYYDPIKEEIKERLNKKKSATDSDTEAEVKARLKGSFRQYKRSNLNPYTGITRGLIVVLFIISIFSMLYIGYYALLLLFAGIIAIYFVARKGVNKSYKHE